MTREPLSLGEHLLHTAEALPAGYRIGGILYGPGHSHLVDETKELLDARLDAEIAHGPVPTTGVLGPHRDHLSLVILGGPEGMQMMDAYWEPGMGTTELEIYRQLRADGMTIKQATATSRSLLP